MEKKKWHYKMGSFTEYLGVRDVVEQKLAASYPKDGFACSLALNEAVNNAFFHGSNHNSLVTITINQLGRSRISIRVKDAGEGFDTGFMSKRTGKDVLWQEHGRGIMLINGFMDRVVYNEKGNEVMMIKEVEG